MKKLYFIKISILIMVSIVLTNCGGGDDNSGGSTSGTTTNSFYTYYADLSNVPDMADFIDPTEAYIKGDAEWNEFFSGSMWSPQRVKTLDGSTIDYRFYPKNKYLNEVIRIVNDNTLVYYNTTIYKDGKGDGEVLYRFYAGSVFGNLAYYGEASYNTYVKIENKLYVTNGDIYTVTSSGLIKDGSSKVLKKYDYIKLNSIASNDYWTTFGGEWTGYEYDYRDGSTNPHKIWKYILQIGSNNKGKLYKYYYKSVTKSEYDNFYGDGYSFYNYGYHYYITELKESENITIEKDNSITDGNNYVIKAGNYKYRIIYSNTNVLGVRDSNNEIIGYTKN